MNFHDYEREVHEAIDRWIDALFRETSKSKIEDLKQDAENLITGWKSAFPKRAKDISKNVSHHLAKRLH